MALLVLVDFLLLLLTYLKIYVFKKQGSSLTQSSHSNKSSLLIRSPYSCVWSTHRFWGTGSDQRETPGTEGTKQGSLRRRSLFLLGSVLPLYEFNKGSTILTFKIIFKDDKILTEASKHWVGRTDSCFPWVARTVSHVSV